METNRRFSILTFPQFFDGNTLAVNIVVLPRNQNPLQPAIEQHDGIVFPPPVIADAPAFADAKLSFDAKIVAGLSVFPHRLLSNATIPLATNAPPQARDLFVALAKNFSISNLNQTNENLDANADNAQSPESKARPQELSVKKYLPFSYRSAFNFTTPRTRNAVTDDSYHCAVRDAGKVPGFTRSPDTISWGKVFAFALRQPLLAEQLGMLYHATLAIDAAHFPQGGWLYVDLNDGSAYKAQQQADDSFVKKYAARIPPLKPNEPRQVFAPLLFPVLYKANAADPDPLPDGNYDQVFIETADYDDGFAKIVHAYQPHSRNLLSEESDGAHPVKDAGVRLGWDDEQILIWYMRQMMIDPTVVTNPDKRLDAPLGVFGYAVDVRDTSNAANPWESLNSVSTKQNLAVANPPNQSIPFANANTTLELPFQVYPLQLDGDKSKTYWLPMYFAHWNGHSMALPDQDAADIYQTTNADVKADPETTIPVAQQDPTDPEYPNKKTGTSASGPAKNQLNQMYAAAPINTALRYGKQYEFRIRLQDLSSGGPALDPNINPHNETASTRAKCQFKRYVAPNQVRVADLVVNTDDLPAPNALSVQRPLLGYPAVVFTGKYANPVQALKDASLKVLEPDPAHEKRHEAFGVADPDVDRVQITVEVQTLRLDNLLSASGRENYVHLYTTTRKFPQIVNEADYDAALNIPLIYRDCPVLHVGDEVDLTNDLQLPGDIDDLAEIYLPTARAIRLTLRAVCEDKADNNAYYGLLNNTNQEMDVRFGHILETRVYQPSTNETALFVNTSDAQRLQGIYLEPDPPNVFDGKLTTLLLGKQVEKAPDLIQRLAKQLDVESIGLTLTAPKGERVQFGCSNRIRHTLSPENSSLIFASQGDLLNHWLCCIALDLDRDWTWDALQDRSFVITRTMRFTNDDVNTETETLEVGAIEVRHTASFEALQNPKRNFTRLIFIDAVEPKNPRTQPPAGNTALRFPDTIEVSYSIATKFKPQHAAQHDADTQLAITLPITIPPAQIPKIASAGIALSPYQRDAKYSATEPRRRYLWIEFEEPIADPNDTFFARVLAYAPDQLISNNQPELFVAPQEPSLPIDPELIRVIPPGATNDLAGLNAMQPMQKALVGDKHYLLPLPPGLHSDAPEMFGFFTYELRVGHYRNAETQEMVWCTAQGRFGRPLRATGIQHPAPTLTCAVNRDEDKLYVTAPYAVAAFNGKNVTADPPRTQLWCLLYAQVKQADDQDFRNILLDDKPLDWRVQVAPDKQVNWFERYDDQQRLTLQNVAMKNWKGDLSNVDFHHVYKLADFVQSNKDAAKYGTTVWSNKEINQLLELYGLPLDLPLSVLVVEILPTITNIYEHITGLAQQQTYNTVQNMFRMDDLPSASIVQEQVTQRAQVNAYRQEASPLSDELGQHRILRTSPLTKAPFVC
ncbi:hypothetical protein FBQ82_01485 [Anaerolineae bacterium CFX7]|nr:hypothetical protein [Anaerolineae bacterium CFX7]